MPATPSTILRAADAGSAWNFCGGDTLITVRYDAGRRRAIASSAGGAIIFETDNPFTALDWMERFDRSALPGSRWAGFIGYEFAREIEALASSTQDDVGFDTFHFSLHLPSETAPDRSPGPACVSRLAGRSMNAAAYQSAVRRALDYIAAGDAFQINLAQRFTFETDHRPQDLWHALTRRDAAAYGAFIDLGDGRALVSDSPELFFRIERRADGTRQIVNRPIKGTRPRRSGMADELLASPKDKAELAMIVDLQRNDLGRVCEIGSVVVREPRAIEATPTVYHGVATIQGTLRRDATFADVIRALFPCGSITGCPKVRAMEIINELEPVARGPYCGAIGYLADDGTIEFNVAIRTIIMSAGLAHVYVGGGIVADSSPQAEYDETLVKAAAMFAALGVSAEEIEGVINA